MELLKLFEGIQYESFKCLTGLKYLISYEKDQDVKSFIIFDLKKRNVSEIFQRILEENHDERVFELINFLQSEIDERK